MNLIVKEFAFSDLFIIWLIILGGFAFLKILKKKLENR